MNTQTRLSELDAERLANLRVRQQLLTEQAQRFEERLVATYGNPDEGMSIGADNSITRTPRPPAPPAVEVPAPNGKGARKPGNR